MERRRIGCRRAPRSRFGGSAAGDTVYCTGRSVRGSPATAGRSETIEETSEMVRAEGGRGIVVRTDHTVESEVERLFNDIWAGAAR